MPTAVLCVGATGGRPIDLAAAFGGDFDTASGAGNTGYCRRSTAHPCRCVRTTCHGRGSAKLTGGGLHGFHIECLSGFGESVRIYYAQNGTGATHWRHAAKPITHWD